MSEYEITWLAYQQAIAQQDHKRTVKLYRELMRLKGQSDWRVMQLWPGAKVIA